MAKKTLLISIFFVLKITAQQFVGCNKGLNRVPSGIYNDTVLKKLIVFADVMYADGVAVNGMATWDGEKFDSLGQGAKRPVGGNKSVIIRYKNRLYAQFNDYHLYSYDYNTKKWAQIPGQFDDIIRDATIYNDELILAGDFQSVGNIKVRNIIKFNGANYDTLPKPLFSFYIRAVEVYKNELYIGGNFDALPFPISAKYDGTSWVSVSPDFTVDGGHEVVDFEIYNGKLFMCGKWTNINGEYSSSIASWDGQKWHNLGGLFFENGITGAIGALKKFNDKLYVFGSFDYADTVRVNNMAVWNDTLWCRTTTTLNFVAGTVDNYNGDWYMAGPQYFLNDTVNFLGKYVGNNGKLEGNCFDKPTKMLQEEITGVLFPNPFSESISFNLNLYFGTSCNLMIVNQIGQVVSVFQTINSNSKLDLSVYSKGLYLFIFENNGVKKTFKVAKD